VLGSYEELHSAFGNLASNAVRYTPAGGTITCAGRMARPAQFIVQDTGIGISQEHIAPDGTFLPRRQEPLARDPGHGPGPGHRQARAAAPRRDAGHPVRGRQGQQLHRQHAQSVVTPLQGDLLVK
jgi:two-component system phosphate regulon sensor histidine kinase PhoR